MRPPNPWDFGWTQLLTITGFAITIFIAIGGFRSFGKWRRERIEEKRIDIAFETLALAYEAKDVFAEIRSPGIFGYEYEDMPVVHGEEDGKRANRGAFYAVQKRILRNKEFFMRAWQLQPRCVAVFGREVADVFKLLHEVRSAITVSANMMVRPDAEYDREFATKMRREVFTWEAESQGQQDETGKKIDQFVEQIEKLCRPIVDRRFK
jgi:hypothetical protein